MAYPNKWPWQGENATVRARRVAQAYRAALELHAPEECARIDAQMAAWGQEFITPRVIRHQPHEWVGVREAAEILCVDVSAIHNLRRRGRLPTRYDPKTGRHTYQVAMLQQLSAEPRRRNQH